MSFYETVFIARQDISSAQAEALADTLAQVAQEHEGKVIGREYWGRGIATGAVREFLSSIPERPRLWSCDILAVLRRKRSRRCWVFRRLQSQGIGRWLRRGCGRSLMRDV
jgi:predicted RNA-binding protein YlqC (UPF0109 family)